MSGDCKDTEDTATLRKESHKLLERLGVLGCNRGIQQFQQKGQMPDGMGGKERYRCLGKGKCFQGLWFLLVKVEVVTSDLGCSQQCSSRLPHEREQQSPWAKS